MSSQYDDPKKQPPPVNIPPLPLPRPVQTPNSAQMNHHGQQRQHRDANNASISMQQAPRSMRSTTLTSPFEQDTTRLPHSQSQTGKSHIAINPTFSNLVDQARVSPHRSDHGSTTGSQRASTTRSRHSGRIYHSAATAQAQLEGLDEKTTRGQIESRSEHRLFKMTGQVPPTPTTGMCSPYHC